MPRLAINSSLGTSEYQLVCDSNQVEEIFVCSYELYFLPLSLHRDRAKLGAARSHRILGLLLCLSAGYQSRWLMGI